MQGGEKLSEKNVVVVGREEDKSIVQDAVKAAEGKWKETYGHEAPKLTVGDEFLAPKDSDDHQNWSVLYSLKNKL